MPESFLPTSITPPQIGQSDLERLLRDYERRLSILEFDSGWIGMTLLNGWLHFDAGTAAPGAGRNCEYRKKAGIVYLQGVMRSGTSGANAFVLPPGFRPPSRNTVDHTVPTVVNGAVTWININGDGSISIAGAAAQSYTYLNGVQFAAGG